MRIMWISAYPLSMTGYGIQTNLVTRGLQAAGAEVHCLTQLVVPRPHPARRP